MGRITSNGDTQVINKKTGQKRFFSDALISNTKFMNDNDWEIFETPEIPESPTFGMDDAAEKLKQEEQAKKEAEEKAEADAKLEEENRLKLEAEEKQKDEMASKINPGVKPFEEITKNEIIVLLEDHNETAEEKVEFKPSESKEILYNKLISINKQ